ncbi:MAG TPA: FAD-dependent oxidoreductase [Solirubrobacteraceae bacterium]|jgi:L-aspartate oxidase|nr:FAD-dependent oxidoreductase [Solirubrobacteraceae bacterium]
MPALSRGQPQLVVVGAGAAGLYTALRAAREGARVTLISATELAQTSSYWAQGGLAAALAAEDSVELHLGDTLAAGRGAVRPSAARVLVEEAPGAVEDLSRLGVTFDADRNGRLALGLEGGHGHRRIVHAGGAATGRRIVRQLSAVVAGEDRIDVREGSRVRALLTHEGRCTGVVLEDGEQLYAPATVLSTGGAAALWARTTNPAGAVGAGLMLAYAAGAALADIEFMQFHPTAVVAGADGSGDGLLVTEAIRGEGAVLLGADGERFVDELAPRDEVARAIYSEMMRRPGTTAVALDMRRVDPALFPTVVASLRRLGIDPELSEIPVAPAAHYMMGGIETDLQARSTLPGLLAVGECSCTGLHGANRLASNSLSECFVFGARAARAALDEPSLLSSDHAASVVAAPSDGNAIALPAQQSRDQLWRHAGLERNAESLGQLLDDPHPLVRLIASAALSRNESRGAHWREDCPETSNALDERHVTLITDQESVFARWK